MKKFKIATLLLPMLCYGAFAHGVTKSEEVRFSSDFKTTDFALDDLSETVQKISAKDKFVGGWSYTVANAPQGYEKGFLVIVKEGDGYKVQVQVGGGNLLGDNVKVSGKTISFDVMIEGGKVAVELSVKGDTISGKSTSSEGTYSIEGERTLAME